MPKTCSTPRAPSRSIKYWPIVATAGALAVADPSPVGVAEPSRVAVGREMLDIRCLLAWKPWVIRLGLDSDRSNAVGAHEPAGAAADCRCKPRHGNSFASSPRPGGRDRGGLLHTHRAAPRARPDRLAGRNPQPSRCRAPPG